MKKILSALALILCLFAAGCGGDTPSDSLPSVSGSAVTTAQSTLPPLSTERFPVPMVGEGAQIEYTPVEGQPQLKKIVELPTDGALSSVSYWDRFMMVNLSHTAEGDYDYDQAADLEEWTELLIIDLLTGETTVSHRMNIGATAGFLENGFICVYEYDPLTIKVFDRAGELSLLYTAHGGGTVVIDPANEGVAWISSWAGEAIERLPLGGGEVRAYESPEADSLYIQTAFGGEAYLTAFDDYGGREMYRLTSDGNCQPISSLDGYSGIGNALFREIGNGWRYVDLRYRGDRVGYFEIEEDAYMLSADDDRFCLEWYDYENGANECRLILCLPSSGRRTDLTLVDRYVRGQCWRDDALYLLLEQGGGNALYVWEYSDAPYEPLETSVYTVSDIELQNRAYADALEEKWDISIYFGEDVTAQMPYDYNATILRDQELIAEKLRELSDILDSYPEGFFSELPYGDYDHFEINLCAGLSPTGGDGINTAIAISNTRGSVLMTVFDVANTDTFEQTFAHELLHLMERRIDQLDPSLLADWSSLTPGGDSAYYFSYHDEHGNEMVDGNNTWYGERDPEQMYFVDAYSKSFPAEDRARIFEYLVKYEGEPPFLDSPVLRTKAARLCEIIRLTFPSVAAADGVAWEGR